MNSRMLKGYIAAVASAVIYGLMPLMSTYIYKEGVNPITLVALRNLLALPVLAAIALKKEKTLKITKKALPGILSVGVMGMCITPLLLLSSYTFIDSSAATVIHFIYPAFVVVGGMIFLREKATVAGMLSLALCVGGIVFCYDGKEGLNLLGAGLALLSGVTCAIYVLLLATFKYKDIPAATFSFYVCSVGGVLTLISCIVTGNLSLPHTLLGWELCILFALSVTVGAVLLYQQSVFIIGGSRSSILSALEPFTGVLVGIIVLGDDSSIYKILGSALVISASLVIAINDLKAQGKANRK